MKVAVFLTCLAAAYGGRDTPLPVTASFEHGPRRPSAVPVLPGLNLGRNPFGRLVGRPIGKPPYEPVDGDSFRRNNGQSTNNYILTSGAWWLLAGDRPRISLALRSNSSA